MKSFIPFFTIALAVGLYFMYISPNLTEISELKMRRIEYENVLAKARELKIERDNALAAYNSIAAEDIARLNKIVPEEFNAVFFANDMSALASAHSLFVKDFNVISMDPTIEEQQAMSNTYKTNIVKMTVTGRYEQFVLFLKDLELSLQLSDIGKLAIKSSAGKDAVAADTPMEFDMELYTYSLK